MSNDFITVPTFIGTPLFEQILSDVETHSEGGFSFIETTSTAALDDIAAGLEARLNQKSALSRNLSFIRAEWTANSDLLAAICSGVTDAHEQWLPNYSAPNYNSCTTLAAMVRVLASHEIGVIWTDILSSPSPRVLHTAERLQSYASARGHRLTVCFGTVRKSENLIARCVSLHDKGRRYTFEPFNLDIAKGLLAKAGFVFARFFDNEVLQCLEGLDTLGKLQAFARAVFRIEKSRTITPMSAITAKSQLLRIDDV